MPAQASVTGVLHAVEQGDREALGTLFELVYEELGVLARQQRRSWHGDLTLTTTGLVHELYLKLTDQKKIPANGRAHFFGVAAKAMRHILCNHARDRKRQKRGGGAEHVRLEPGEDVLGQVELSEDRAETLAALDEALKALERFSERQARVVECRVFGGMGIEDTAMSLGISTRTVKRDWMFARAWLRREMQLTLG